MPNATYVPDNVILIRHGNTGRYVDPLRLTPEDIEITGIAESLSKLPRYTGWTYGEFGYSVAQHSILCAWLVTKWGADSITALSALLHDAWEAFGNDLVRPIKELKGIGESYCAAEEHGLQQIAIRFGLPMYFWNDPAVKSADQIMLATERRDLLPPTEEKWGVLKGIEASKELALIAVRPSQARSDFLEAFEMLKNESGLGKIPMSVSTMRSHEEVTTPVVRPDLVGIETVEDGASVLAAFDDPGTVQVQSKTVDILPFVTTHIHKVTGEACSGLFAVVADGNGGSVGECIACGATTAQAPIGASPPTSYEDVIASAVRDFPSLPTRPSIIGFSGLKGAGKDTAGEYLVEIYGFERKSFAAKMKQSAAALFGVNPEFWDEAKNLSMSEMRISLKVGSDLSGFIKDDHGSSVREIVLTIREFLQRYGTEAHRDIFGGDFWVNALRDEIASTQGPYVITDCRFEEEAKMVHDLDGFIVEIRRSKHGDVFSDNHPSEMPPSSYDLVVENYGDIDDLHDSLDLLMERLGYEPRER